MAPGASKCPQIELKKQLQLMDFGGFLIEIFGYPGIVAPGSLFSQPPSKFARSKTEKCVVVENTSKGILRGMDGSIVDRPSKSLEFFDRA